jgi:hypothetical protein
MPRPQMPLSRGPVRRYLSGHRNSYGLAGLFVLSLAIAGCSSPSAAKTATKSGETSLDLASAGSHQSVVQVVVPTDFSRAMNEQPGIGETPIPGTEFAFEVNGSPPIAVGEESASLVLPGRPVSSARTYRSFGVWYMGTGLMNGTGIDGQQLRIGSSGTAASPVGIISDWPTKGEQLYAWARLPTRVKYVTYSYEKADRTWVFPVHGAALLLVPRPAAFDGDYATWHSAPFPLLTAYDAAGRIVEQQYAPRIGGDNVPKVS